MHKVWLTIDSLRVTRAWEGAFEGDYLWNVHESASGFAGGYDVEGTPKDIWISEVVEIDLDDLPQPPTAVFGGVDYDTLAANDPLPQITIPLTPIRHGGKGTEKVPQPLTDDDDAQWQARVVVQPSRAAELADAPDFGGAFSRTEPSLAFVKHQLPVTAQATAPTGIPEPDDLFAAWQPQKSDLASQGGEARAERGVGQVLNVRARELVVREDALSGYGGISLARGGTTGSYSGPGSWRLLELGRTNLYAMGDVDVWRMDALGAFKPGTRIHAPANPEPNGPGYGHNVARPAVCWDGRQWVVAHTTTTGIVVQYFDDQALDAVADYATATQRVDVRADTAVAPAIAQVGDQLWLAWCEGAAYAHTTQTWATGALTLCRIGKAGEEHDVVEIGAPTSRFAPALASLTGKHLIAAITDETGHVHTVRVDLGSAGNPSNIHAPLDTGIRSIAGPALTTRPAQMTAGADEMWVGWIGMDRPWALNYRYLTPIGR